MHWSIASNRRLHRPEAEFGDPARGEIMEAPYDLRAIPQGHRRGFGPPAAKKTHSSDAVIVWV
jgi:hypothetical protein